MVPALIPIAGETLGGILSLAKTSAERRSRLIAHTRILLEREMTCEKILHETLAKEEIARKEWEERTPSRPYIVNHRFGTHSWVMEEKRECESRERADLDLMEALDRNQRAIQELTRIREEKRVALEALQEYQLEGEYCIIS